MTTSGAALTTSATATPRSVWLRFSVPIGAVRPLYATAAGRVLLAFVEPAWLEEYRRFWDRQYDKLDTLLGQLQARPPKSPKRKRH